MSTPDIQYARSGDVMIAYQVTGEANPVDVVLTPGIVSHLDLDWEFPTLARFIRELSSFCRLIRFDKRGTGLSDRTTDVGTLEERTDDIRAVMDAVGSRRAHIIGVSEGGNMSCVFAAAHPERTLGLVLWGTNARYVSAEDYPIGRDLAELMRIADDVAARGVTAEYLTAWPGGMEGADPADLAIALRYYRGSASPSQMAAILRMFAEVDTRGILGSIQVPTIVMNRVDDPVTPMEAARALTAGITGARLMEFLGNSHDIDGPPQEAEILEAIHEFVTGEIRKVPNDRVLATVLFTDIVGSTARAVELGDARWKTVLAEHDERARAEIERHRGIYIHTTGDGLLATFDGPARAVRCARAIGEGVRPLGIEIRAGCHTGEVELVGAMVQGVAVHIGARVAALAGDGDVLVSSTVKDLVAGSGLSFEDAGEHELKGVPDRWRLFPVVS